MSDRPIPPMPPAGILEPTTLRQPPPGRGLFATMGEAGDTRCLWDPRNTEQVDAARMQFNHLMAKGYLAFKVGERGRKGEQITEFDASAGKIILAPRMAGGAYFAPGQEEPVAETSALAGHPEAAEPTSAAPLAQASPGDPDYVVNSLHLVIAQLEAMEEAEESDWNAWCGVPALADDPVFAGAIAAARASLGTAAAYYTAHLAEA